VRIIPCNVCGERRDFVEAFVDRPANLRVVRCRGCGLVFVNPTFTLQEHHAYYATRYWNDIPTDGRGNYTVFPPEKVERWKRRALAHLDYLSTFCDHLKGQPKLNVLEVGCGYGAHLEEVRRRCPEAKLAAVEPNTRVYASIRSRMPEVQILGKSLETLSGARMLFDCVITASVLEHATDPSSALKRIHAMLAPNAMCLIVTHNQGGHLSHVYDLDHLYYFTEGTLHTLLTGSHLDVVRLDVRGEYGVAGDDCIYAIVRKK
jgi:SAM-dependent methyltransferase